MSTKVFVGNLAFRTTDQALQEAFSKCGEVKSGVIITRGRRSLGYGFVEFLSAEHAAASVDKMNKAEIFGRQIKVELAKDPSERPPPSEGGGEPGPAKRRRRAPGPPRDSSDATTTSPGSAGTRTGASEGGDGEGSRKPRFRKIKTEGTVPSDGNPTSPPATPAPPKQRIPSKTTLFVANLPFSIDDEQLAKVFEGCKMKSAHVVRTRTGRSRGYGFVEFESETDQSEALKTINGKQVEGANGTRNISVTISNSVASSQPNESTSDEAHSEH